MTFGLQIYTSCDPKLNAPPYIQVSLSLKDLLAFTMREIALLIKKTISFSEAP